MPKIVAVWCTLVTLAGCVPTVPVGDINEQKAFVLDQYSRIIPSENIYVVNTRTDGRSKAQLREASGRKLEVGDALKDYFVTNVLSTGETAILYGFETNTYKGKFLEFSFSGSSIVKERKTASYVNTRTMLKHDGVLYLGDTSSNQIIGLNIDNFEVIRRLGVSVLGRFVHLDKQAGVLYVSEGREKVDVVDLDAFRVRETLDVFGAVGKDHNVLAEYWDEEARAILRVTRSEGGGHLQRVLVGSNEKGSNTIKDNDRREAINIGKVFHKEESIESAWNQDSRRLYIWRKREKEVTVSQLVGTQDMGLDQVLTISFKDVKDVVGFELARNEEYFIIVQREGFKRVPLSYVLKTLDS